MTYPCIKHIATATQAHHVREIFKKSYAFIREPEVHGPIFERIKELLKHSADAQLIKDLGELKEDIEDEIESSSILRSELATASKTKSKGLSYNPKEKFLEIFGANKVFRSSKEEHQDVYKTIDDCGGNKTRAARALGISTRVLRNKMSKLSREQ